MQNHFVHIKSMNKKILEYKGYTLSYYFKPGINSDEKELEEIEKKLNIVNKESGKNFSYGIFDPKNKKDFYDTSLICILEIDNKPAGFFYNVILEFSSIKIVHQGLVLISKNIGENLLYYPYVQSNIFIRENIGDYYITSISSVPSIIGEIHNIFEEVWPSPFANLVRPPKKEYAMVAEKVFNEYVKKYFPFPEEVTFNKKRFIIESKAKEMGFERDVRNLSRDSRLEVNLFCQFWIDYTKNEDIIQVGYFGNNAVEKNNQKIKEVK